MSEVVKCGDWTQIKHLSNEYKELLKSKDTFLELINKKPVSNYERIEAELHVAVTTGRLKAIDAKIHHLMFGSEITAETSPKSIDFLLRKAQTETEIELRSRLRYIAYRLDEKINEVVQIREKFYNANAKIKKLEKRIK